MKMAVAYIGRQSFFCPFKIYSKKFEKCIDKSIYSHYNKSIKEQSKFRDRETFTAEVTAPAEPSANREAVKIDKGNRGGGDKRKENKTEDNKMENKRLQRQVREYIKMTVYGYLNGCVDDGYEALTVEKWIEYVMRSLELDLNSIVNGEEFRHLYFYGKQNIVDEIHRFLQTDEWVREYTVA